ncbi:Anthranilate synthase component II [Sesbania bispinosa]|nr:Anthranilate synthase component II [Sesbania bispinosa]
MGSRFDALADVSKIDAIPVAKDNRDNHSHANSAQSKKGSSNQLKGLSGKSKGVRNDNKGGNNGGAETSGSKINGIPMQIDDTFAVMPISGQVGTKSVGPVLNSENVFRNDKDVVNSKSADVPQAPIIGPAQQYKRKMGLNLKSLVRFKSVKTAARKSGSFPILSMPLLHDTINVASRGTPEDEPHPPRPKGDMDVFNNRPPDGFLKGATQVEELHPEDFISRSDANYGLLVVEAKQGDVT